MEIFRSTKPYKQIYLSYFNSQNLPDRKQSFFLRQSPPFLARPLRQYRKSNRSPGCYELALPLHCKRLPGKRDKHHQDKRREEGQHAYPAPDNHTRSAKRWRSFPDQTNRFAGDKIKRVILVHPVVSAVHRHGAFFSHSRCARALVTGNKRRMQRPHGRTCK